MIEKYFPGYAWLKRIVLDEKLHREPEEIQEIGEMVLERSDVLPEDKFSGNELTSFMNSENPTSDNVSFTLV